MKKRIVLLSFLLISTISFAQGNMRFGIKAGPNFSTIIETATRKNSDLTRRSTINQQTFFHIGFVFEFLFSEHISIQGEALYSAQGAKLLNSYASADGRDIHRKINYAIFPIFGKYYLTPQLSIELGPQIGLVINAKDDFGNLGERNIEKEIKGHDFSVAGGIAFELINGIFLQGRYTMGLTNINGKGGVVNFYQHRNREFQISIGYIF